MAVNAGQERWSSRTTVRPRELGGRVVRSARSLGKSALSLGAVVPARVLDGEGLRSAVSPHWKRVSAGSHLQAGARTISCNTPAGENEVSVKPRGRGAVLASDFRFVSAGSNNENESARLERDFEKFAASFGGVSADVLEPVSGSPWWTDFDIFGESGSSKTSVAKGKKVRFAERENDTFDLWRTGSPSPMMASAQAYTPQMTTIPTRQGLPGTYDTSPERSTWTRLWTESEGSSLHRNAVEDPSTDELWTSAAETADQTPPTLLSDQDPNEPTTKATASSRLQDLERHLSLASETHTLARNTSSISLQDFHLSHGPLDQAPQLLSASLGTTVSPPESTGTNISFFYCHHLDCHQRLVYQNAHLPPSIHQRCCVHTGCGFVGHNLEGWVKHCMTPHHGSAASGCVRSCECCYTNEDTH